MSRKQETHIAGTVTVQWSIPLPHSRVDTETVHHVICDALRATFGVRPRDNGPTFNLFTGCTDGDVEIEEDDRHDPPAEFNSGLQWYVETAIHLDRRRTDADTD